MMSAGLREGQPWSVPAPSPTRAVTHRAVTHRAATAAAPDEPRPPAAARGRGAAAPGRPRQSGPGPAPSAAARSGRRLPAAADWRRAASAPLRAAGGGTPAATPPGPSAPSRPQRGLSPLRPARLSRSPARGGPRSPGAQGRSRPGPGGGARPQGRAAPSRTPKRSGRRAPAAKTPRILYRGKSASSSKMGRQGPGGAGAAGRSMQRSQSRSSLSASFEALAGYFPCMNSLQEEEGEAAAGVQLGPDRRWSEGRRGERTVRSRVPPPRVSGTVPGERPPGAWRAAGAGRAARSGELHARCGVRWWGPAALWVPPAWWVPRGRKRPQIKGSSQTLEQESALDAQTRLRRGRAGRAGARLRGAAPRVSPLVLERCLYDQADETNREGDSLF